VTATCFRFTRSRIWKHCKLYNKNQKVTAWSWLWEDSRNT